MNPWAAFWLFLAAVFVCDAWIEVEEGRRPGASCPPALPPSCLGDTDSRTDNSDARRVIF